MGPCGGVVRGGPAGAGLWWAWSVWLGRGLHRLGGVDARPWDGGPYIRGIEGQVGRVMVTGEGYEGEEKGGERLEKWAALKGEEGRCR